MKGAGRRYTVDRLVKLLNDRFDAHAVRIGYTREEDVIPAEELPDEFMETMRLTVEDLLDSDWFVAYTDEVKRMTYAEMESRFMRYTMGREPAPGGVLADALKIIRRGVKGDYS